MDSHSKTVRKQKKPSFYKILFDDFSACLQIPTAFTKKFGKQIPHTSKLEVKGYHEKSWEVELEKIGEIHCFRKGWREFVEENNLEHWDFLVFKYLADSKLFTVTIYGRTCCVKEFPVSRGRNSEPLNGNSQRNVQDEGKRKWVQEDDDYADSNIDQELKGTRMIKCELDGDKAYESHVIHVDSDSFEDENLGDFMQTRCNQRKNNKTLKRGGKSNGLPTHDDENRIEFNSQNPFFKVKLKYSEVVGHYLYIPQGFRKHLSNKEDQEAKFQICEDIWRGHIVMITDRGKKRTRNEVRIYRGWSNLLKDKGLKLGDVCIFEMIKSEEDDDDVVVFKVHVYRWDGNEAEFVKIW